MKLTNIGYGNTVATNRIIAIVNPDAAPVRRMVSGAKDTGRIIDATCGHKTRSVLITDSDHVILSALMTETLAARVGNQEIALEEDGE